MDPKVKITIAVITVLIIFTLIGLSIYFGVSISERKKLAEEERDKLEKKYINIAYEYYLHSLVYTTIIRTPNTEKWVKQAWDKKMDTERVFNEYTNKYNFDYGNMLDQNKNIPGRLKTLWLDKFNKITKTPVVYTAEQQEQLKKGIMPAPTEKNEQAPVEKNEPTPEQDGNNTTTAPAPTKSDPDVAAVKEAITCSMPNISIDGKCYLPAKDTTDQCTGTTCQPLCGFGLDAATALAECRREFVDPKYSSCKAGYKFDEKTLLCNAGIEPIKFVPLECGAGEELYRGICFPACKKYSGKLIKNELTGALKAYSFNDGSRETAAKCRDYKTQTLVQSVNFGSPRKPAIFADPARVNDITYNKISPQILDPTMKKLGYCRDGSVYDATKKVCVPKVPSYTPDQICGEGYELIDGKCYKIQDKGAGYSDDKLKFKNPSYSLSETFVTDSAFRQMDKVTEDYINNFNKKISLN